MPRPHVRIIDAWNGWYHVNGNTYGTWLRGEPRGWRSRHHREHVEGDYKNPPPPGAHDEAYQKSKRLMEEPVFLSRQARAIACAELVASLQYQSVEPIACCVDGHHYHILARMVMPEVREHVPAWLVHTRHQPIYAFIRHVVGLAKSRAARAISGAGHAPEGGVWAKRFKITPIRDRAHQLQVVRYIQAHANRGAAAWLISNSPDPGAGHRAWDLVDPRRGLKRLRTARLSVLP